MATPMKKPITAVTQGRHEVEDKSRVPGEARGEEDDVVTCKGREVLYIPLPFVLVNILRKMCGISSSRHVSIVVCV